MTSSWFLIPQRGLFLFENGGGGGGGGVVGGGGADDFALSICRALTYKQKLFNSQSMVGITLNKL